MSNVVSLKPDRRRIPRQGSAETAKIVFFTGVRYVRFSDGEGVDAVLATAGAEACGEIKAPALVERLQA